MRTDALKHLLLPALVLSIAPAISIGRILRASVERRSASDHVRTARSKGLTETAVRAPARGAQLAQPGALDGRPAARVHLRRAWSSSSRSSAGPASATTSAASIPDSDFPAIAGVTIVLGAIYIVVNAVVDILQAIADPRIVN